jgi:hypothetical protein
MIATITRESTTTNRSALIGKPIDAYKGGVRLQGPLAILYYIKQSSLLRPAICEGNKKGVMETVALDEVSELCLEEFRNDYFLPGKPVVGPRIIALTRRSSEMPCKIHRR